MKKVCQICGEEIDNPPSAQELDDYDICVACWEADLPNDDNET